MTSWTTIHTAARRLIWGLAICCLCATILPAATRADDRRDHEIARRALLDGRIRPLAEIRRAVAPKLPGKIIGVEFEVNDFGRLVYEFDVVTPGGLLKEVDVDALTAEIISIEAGG